jgi:hypothetical protein
VLVRRDGGRDGVEGDVVVGAREEQQQWARKVLLWTWWGWRIADLDELCCRVKAVAAARTSVSVLKLVG